MSEITMARYEVRLFARLKEHAGREIWVHEEQVGLPAGELLRAFFAQYPALDELRPATRIAVNHVFQHGDIPLKPEDELAFIPPVSGG